MVTLSFMLFPPFTCQHAREFLHAELILANSPSTSHSKSSLILLPKSIPFLLTSNKALKKRQQKLAEESVLALKKAV
jgi:hypothetical protein